MSGGICCCYILWVAAGVQRREARSAAKHPVAHRDPNTHNEEPSGPDVSSTEIEEPQPRTSAGNLEPESFKSLFTQRLSARTPTSDLFVCSGFPQNRMAGSQRQESRGDEHMHVSQVMAM